MSRYKFFFCFYLFALGNAYFATSARAQAIADTRKQATETDFFSARILSEDVIHWLTEMPNRPASIAIFDIREKPPLTPNFSILFETELTSGMQQIDGLTVINCFDCRGVRATVVDEKVMVTKGAPDLERYKAIARKLQVEAFLLVEAQRTSVSSLASVSLYSAAGQVLAAKNFSEQVLDLDGGAAMIGLQGAVGVAAGGPDRSDGTPPFAASAFLLQEMNGKKGGLVFGGISDGGSAAGYIQPTLGWRRRSVASLVGLAMVGLGIGGSTEGFGISARGAYQVFLGYAAIGVEIVGIVPIGKDKDKNVPDGFLGLTMGIVLGR